MNEPSYPTYDRLIALLDEKQARYRVIEHAPEGRTEVIGAIRGNALSQSAKCIIVMLKIDKKTTRHVLVVAPGDTKVDFRGLKALYGASYAYARSHQSRTPSVWAAVWWEPSCRFHFTPTSSSSPIRSFLATSEIFFNAARLDRSLCLATEDYRAIAAPRVAQVATA